MPCHGHANEAFCGALCDLLCVNTALSPLCPTLYCYPVQHTECCYATCNELSCDNPFECNHRGMRSPFLYALERMKGNLNISLISNNFK